jgi:hypothetical protein
MFQHLVEILCQLVEALIAAKVGGGDQLHINAHDFGMKCSTSRCPHTFGDVVYVVETSEGPRIEPWGTPLVTSSV